jgi:hypothetical protein
MVYDVWCVMGFIEWRSEVIGVRGRVVVSVLEFVVLLASGLRY